MDVFQDLLDAHFGRTVLGVSALGDRLTSRVVLGVRRRLSFLGEIASGVTFCLAVVGLYRFHRLLMFGNTRFEGSDVAGSERGERRLSKDIAVVDEVRNRSGNWLRF